MLWRMSSFDIAERPLKVILPKNKKEHAMLKISLVSDPAGVE